MAFKFALVVVVACFAQAFAGVVEEKPNNLIAPSPCKEAVAEEIKYDFEEAMFGMDEIRDEVSVATMEAYFKGADPLVIIACFREQRGNYVKLGQRIAGLIRNASQELAKDLGDKYEKFAKAAEVPLRNIAITMKTLPEKMYELIKNQEFGKALELMKESRRIVEENAKALAKIVSDLEKELPEVAEKAVKMAREIRNEARKGYETIAKAFRQCVENGGPQKPIESASSESSESSEE